MAVTFVKTFKRTTVANPWFDAFTPAWSELQTTWKASGKILGNLMEHTKPDPLTRIFTRTFVNQAAFDDWFSNPIVATIQIQQRAYEITNNITWTRVITNTDTGTTTTDSSADYSLSLSKG